MIKITEQELISLYSHIEFNVSYGAAIYYYSNDMSIEVVVHNDDIYLQVN